MSLRFRSVLTVYLNPGGFYINRTGNIEQPSFGEAKYLTKFRALTLGFDMGIPGHVIYDKWLILS
jgi:hypothetical protein